ncbi:MAG: TetR family transcriptional regulator [Actinomycetota bacterium]
MTDAAPDLATRTTAERLESAALSLFDRHGYDAVTTEQIAAAAEVSARTFFRHFPTKLDALLGDVEQRTIDFAVRLHRQPPDLDLSTALASAIAEEEVTADDAAADLIRARVLRATPSLAEAVRAYEVDLERHIGEWIAQRTVRPADDFEVRVAAGAFVAARRVVIEEWQRSDGVLDIVELARRSLQVVAVSLR